MNALKRPLKLRLECINMFSKFRDDYFIQGNVNKPEYKREDNFVNQDLLEGLTWKNPSLQHNNVDKVAIQNITMMVFGGFILALGIAVVAIAFTLLNAATGGVAGIVVASVGASTALFGMRLFANITCNNRQISSDESLNSPGPSSYLSFS